MGFINTLETILSGDKVELLQKECIASVTLFDLRTSEGELMVYESCIDYVLTHCSKDELLRLIKIVERPECLPERYKNL